mgnify:CR=1 FL=1
MATFYHKTLFHEYKELFTALSDRHHYGLPGQDKQEFRTTI